MPPLTSGLAQVWRTEVISAANPCCALVFGLTFSNPPADFATLLVCWLVLSLQGNFVSLMCSSTGRTVINFHTFAKPMTLADIFIRLFHSKNVILVIKFFLMSKKELKDEISKVLDHFSDKALNELLNFLKELDSKNNSNLSVSSLDKILHEDKELLAKLAQ